MKRLTGLLILLTFMVSGYSQGVLIGPGTYVTVQNSAYLTTTGTAGLTIRSDATGTGSLVAPSSGVSFRGTGTAEVERYINNNSQWHFLSSPVTPSDMNIWPEFAPEPSSGIFASPFHWDVYYWNPNCSYTNGLPWVNLRLNGGVYNGAAVEATGSGAGFGSSPAKFETGRGYLVAYSSSWSGTTHTFTGTLNAGSQSRTISKNTTVEGGNAWNMVGNPYPSAIDWAATSGWDRTNMVVNGSTSGGYDYWSITSSGNYGVCNSATPESATLGTSRYIAPMQAFFVKAYTTGTFSMNDDVRAHNAQTWLKSAKQQPGLLRLELHTDANSFYDEMIVEFNPASAGCGSSKFASLYPEAPEICAVKEGNRYSIDRYTAFDPGLSVQLYVKCGVAGNYTITATNIRSFGLGNAVILEDLKTGIRVNLKATGSYSFYGLPSDSRERFLLKFANGTSVQPDESAIACYVYTSGRELFLGSATPAPGTREITVYDLSGRLVFSSRLNLTAGKQLITTLPATGTYIVRINDGHTVVAEKVMVW